MKAKIEKTTGALVALPETEDGGSVDDPRLQQLLEQNEQLREQVAQLSILNVRLDKKLFDLRTGVSALSAKIKDKK